MSRAAEWAMRWRVRLGYPLVFVYFWLAQPTRSSILAGSVVAILGLIVRGAAAGYLRKHEELATSGPYSYTRNPLYFGSALLSVGLLLAGWSWILAVILIVYFAAFYPAVMKKEEEELRTKYGSVFEDYARCVPQFFPRISSSASAGGKQAQFSWAVYLQNREWQAAAGAAFVALFLWLKMSLF